MLTKDELLEPLARHRAAGSVFVTCMGVTRPWGRYSSSPIDFAGADTAMGHTADLALGIAIAQPDRRVVCLNGDGSMLMALGTLAVAAQAGARNYVLIVVQNGTYEITGNQPVPAAGSVDFAAIARGVGIPSCHTFDDATAWERAVPSLLAEPGPVFIAVRVRPGDEGPISRSADEASVYLRRSTADWAHAMRAALLEPPTPAP
jgi:thiamine pyrophosphate-dependent acetolactate synthase large subunit-like protein